MFANLNHYSRGVMFVLNGIVYANEKSENIQVVSVKPLDDMMMILTFSTGEQRLFDASILTGSAYKPLSDEDTFKNCKVVDGVVTCLYCLDCFLYLCIA